MTAGMTKVRHILPVTTRSGCRHAQNWHHIYVCMYLFHFFVFDIYGDHGMWGSITNYAGLLLPEIDVVSATDKNDRGTGCVVALEQYVCIDHCLLFKLLCHSSSLCIPP